MPPKVFFPDVTPKDVLKANDVKEKGDALLASVRVSVCVYGFHPAGEEFSPFLLSAQS